VPGFRRVSHGLYLPHDESADGRSETLRELSAWRLVLPEDAVFTHVTAAWLFGWWLPQLPEHVPVFASTAMTARPRRAGLICTRLASVGADLTRVGQPVDLPAEVLLRCARDLGMIDLVVLVESALRSGDIDEAQLAAITGSTRPGVRRLRVATAHADPRSESMWETALRLFHELAGISVDVQVDLHDHTGRRIGRGDLVVRGRRDVHEFDGGHHDEPVHRTRDRRRDRELIAADYVRRGFTKPDLTTTPMQTLRELDAVIDRPHDPRRLRRWTAWLRESCLSPAGRRRLQNRWLAAGLWSQSA
jgi:hypothetical protein